MLHLPTCEPLERRTLMAAPVVLFVRGADRSGGFLEAKNDAGRNEQLADINNTSTASGNHGWATLAATLRGAGYVVEQMAEPLEPNAPATGQTQGAPIKFESMTLSRYSTIVFASNNAQYPKASVDAIENYIKNGGGAIFISDANFGSSWRDAPDSDQAFLSRFGLKVQQDNGVYPLTRAGGDFAKPKHPVLFGVDAFDGEGVSPLVVPATPPAGVRIERIVGARTQTRNNNGTSASNKFQGTLRNVTSSDAALVFANAGKGRVAGYFDRNTFFNAGGAGTNINRYNNRQLALNLFKWTADKTPPNAIVMQYRPTTREVRMTFDDNLYGSLVRGDIVLKNRTTGALIPGDRWTFSLAEAPDRTYLTIKISTAQPGGAYQLEIGAGKINDDSGNVRTTAIRFDFTI
ncbi:MAG: hypothetical protein QOE14_1018 [Humisphaera sp.]|nr:hypothetical protein [Humisphaera sp.]